MVNQNPQTSQERPPVGYYAFLSIIALVVVIVVGYLVSSYFS